MDRLALWNLNIDPSNARTLAWCTMAHIKLPTFPPYEYIQYIWDKSLNLYQCVVDKRYQMSFFYFFVVMFLSLTTLWSTSFIATCNIVATTDMTTVVAESIKPFSCIMHFLCIQTLVVRGNEKDRRHRRIMYVISSDFSLCTKMNPWERVFYFVF